MGIKSRIKKWLSVKIKNVLDDQKQPQRLLSNALIEVGKDSFHNGNFDIRGNNKIRIGSFCAFGKDIKLITSNHDYNYTVMQYGFYKKYFNVRPKSKKNEKVLFSIEIGNDVWIGDNVSILPNVKIGTGSVIATASVVTKDVLPYTIVGGVPAKFIKDRFPESSKNVILESEWWNWNDDVILKNKDFFFKNWNANE